MRKDVIAIQSSSSRYGLHYSFASQASPRSVSQMKIRCAARLIDHDLPLLPQLLRMSAGSACPQQLPSGLSAVHYYGHLAIECIPSSDPPSMRVFCHKLDTHAACRATLTACGSFPQRIIGASSLLKYATRHVAKDAAR